MQLKRCSKCHRNRALDKFPHDKTRPDGFYPSCKGCYRKRVGSKRFNPRTKIRNGKKVFRCSLCKRLKARTEFYTNPSNKDGIHGECKECSRKRTRSELAKTLQRGRRQRDRMEVLLHYSSGKLSCACCGESHNEFLCIDHINGGGKKHRAKVKNGHFYRWLIKEGFPRGLRVLCHNCNMAYGFYGRCPHINA